MTARVREPGKALWVVLMNRTMICTGATPVQTAYDYISALHCGKVLSTECRRVFTIRLSRAAFGDARGDEQEH
ncbi:hypothetical protein GCM10009780_64850 [Actinomadura alba]